MASGVLLFGAEVRAEAKKLEVTVVMDPSSSEEERSNGSTSLSTLSGLESLREGLVFRGASGSGGARILIDGRPLGIGSSIPKRARTIAVEGTKPGKALLDLGAASITVRVLGMMSLDAAGRRVSFTASNASIERMPPARELPTSAASGEGSPDALRYLLVGAREDLPASLTIVSKDPKGAKLDTLAADLAHIRCPKEVAGGLSCKATALIRAVADDVDRNHPLVAERSIRAEVGGALEIWEAERRLHAIPVGGPRSTPAGAISRLRGRLRVTIVRDTEGGSVPFGANEADAIELARRQVAWTNALWGQCGVSFGAPEEAIIRVIDPPPPHLLAVGCDLGLPATGGEARFRIEGRDLHAKLAPGMSPRAAARVIANTIESAGFVARLSENVRIAPGAYPTVDLLVRRRDGRLARIEPPTSGHVSSDPTMNVCIGEVDLADGLEHFTDVDAAAGTVEERTLIKAFDDAEPGTIEVVLIPAFARGGRIGESFIFTDRSSIRNVVLEDRAGVRADRASFALAHELGHVLLDMPGHPDDFGVDTPTLLMDSDAADLSAFGPRRLGLDECARALRQSGPKAPTVLLEDWPLR